MTPPDRPVLYELVYSGRARGSIMPLVERAAGFGLRREVATAFVTIDRLLRLYPQFGEPLRDLPAQPGTEWIGFVGPLTVRYVVFDELRQVWIVRPITLSRERGFGEPD